MGLNQPMSPSVFPPFRTLSLVHPRRLAAERAFGAGAFRKIIWQPEGEIGACAATVAHAMTRWGGAPVLGLHIHVWPKLFIEAMPHYVWCRPDGFLVDLTDKYPTDPIRHSVFVPFAGGNDMAPGNSRYFVLRNVPQVMALINTGVEQVQRRRRIEEGIRARQGANAGDGRLLDYAEAQEKAILDQDERRVAAAIRACLDLEGRSDCSV